MKKMTYNPQASIYRILTLSILIVGLITEGVAFGSIKTTAKTSRGSAKAVGISTGDAIVLEWNDIATRRILTNGPPFTAARFMTMTQLAVFATAPVHAAVTFAPGMMRSSAPWMATVTSALQ